ncbi:hypothetical protein [Methylobrevis albus]|uniref:Uncharacterized protein n=1 Tax=Methylobrevis albus TaxID=2793297 RepID=A0A931MYW7_9HYPH|nr:hypothetical protein [Methylobrevis albus]MBH0238882.1 hypothetical protein [Methylobrevis albus]
MRRPALIIGMVILAAAATILVASHGSESVLGMHPEQFASLAQLGALLLVITSGFLFSARSGGGMLPAALLWGGLAAALVIGYQLFGGQ